MGTAYIKASVSLQIPPVVMIMSVVLGCGGPGNDPANTPHGKITHAFAKALASGDFSGAHQMLTPELGATLSPANLKAEYEQMISYVGKTTATDVEIMNTLEDFPAKKPTDIGWAYASISGPDPGGGSWGEAVAAIVTDRQGRLLIREIEWGRP